MSRKADRCGYGHSLTEPGTRTPGGACRLCRNRFVREWAQRAKLRTEEVALSIEEALAIAMARSEPEPNTGCWLWTGATFNKGYAYVQRRGLLFTLTRALIGLPRKGGELQALHTCDTSACVNRDHLDAGTESENIRDRVSRHRTRNQTCRKPEPLARAQ